MHSGLLFVSLVAAVAEVLFPTPLHLTRQIHDSIGGATVTVEQYCYGNRVVSVSGAVTSIADYEKNELTEINRDEGTYSITRFDDVARALNYGAPPAKASSEALKADWEIRNNAGNALEAELDEGTTKRQTRVAVDRSVSISKDALDVLIGAAYPNSRKPEDAIAVQAAKGERAYALPVEQKTTFIIGGDGAEMRDVVTRVGNEQVPPELIAVPPDAKLVESRLMQRMHAIELLESAGRQ